ncbi:MULTISPECIES: sugar porter family MFS transporter [unclassified Pseudoxanthomonas]|jgi:SP family sugar:H+ symporter-like MFS transporter|uniref:sugar porter family MFS transporter n=1 Tax=unclassified Pseudoxanthomonas TaxID=2645906 RepID=UPI001141A6E0|nr:MULTISPECIES: sugar porter family MFS transporter [unclassified Pseudoxanthomonas]MBB3275919.1 SP family sugar:H+ symporter-like MFS transporter [Pseudoxanthomonas sp. OG2]MBV7472998.1 sugar porter family MFS transporter [Pseudoxanthomonas sp. PXM05]MCL6712566.1 sugar porter family MFS transporter [Pseudomonas sp. R2.Fl]UBB24805.1 sugar porter family MFS transporter [Pseudoxanthomonas japonensis]
MSQALTENENTRLIVLISVVATIGGFLFGFDSGVINGTVDGLQQAFGSSKAGLGFEVASMLLGCAVGAFFAGRLADRWGRRSVLIISAALFLLSAIGAGAAHSSLVFVAARVLGGFAVGAASVISPAYIAEVAPARYRGRLATVQQIAIISGLFAAFLSNYLLARAAGASTGALWGGQAAWRWMFWMQAFPSLLFLVLLLTIPESPRYLVVKRRKDEAMRVLTRLFGAGEARVKLAEIDASLSEDHHRPRLSDLKNKATGRIRPIVWVGIGLATFQQLVGINVVFYYGAVLWQAVGFSENDALLINVLSGALSIGACLVTVLLIDRIGRKPLLWIGSAGMAASLALVVWAFASGSLVDGHLQLPGGMGTLALVAANLYVVFFNLSWGPVMWVMLGEMFPNQIRGSALAVAGAAQWTSNFAITVTFPILLAAIGLAATYGIYLAAAVISVFFVLKYVHETKGKELEQMEG